MNFVKVNLDKEGIVEDFNSFMDFNFNDNDWYIFSDKECELNPILESLIASKSLERPDIDIFYGDEIILGANEQIIDVIYKPSFDITQLIAQDYVGWPIAVKGNGLKKMDFSDSLLIYDFLLQSISLGLHVYRIPEYFSKRKNQRLRASSSLRFKSLQHRVLIDNPDYEILPGRLKDTFRLQKVFHAIPKVTIIVPTCQASPPNKPQAPYILSFLKSLSASDWNMDSLTVIVGDDCEERGLYENNDWPFDLKVVSTNRLVGDTFNYAKKMNSLWPLSDDEYIIFMNDDLLVINPDWIKALMSFATDEDVGGVGARLLYPNKRLQHVGMAAGVLGPCTHLFIGEHYDAATYENWADVHRELSIVTGAVFCTKKSLMKKIKGFDQTFSLNFNDVDMCLRLKMLGYRIIYTPHAELTHFESASRGFSPQPGFEIALFIERWNAYLLNDPFYHPKLTKKSSNPNHRLFSSKEVNFNDESYLMI